MRVAGKNWSFVFATIAVGAERHSLPERATVPLAIAIAPASVVGGNPATATITLGTPAPAGGTEITLTSLTPAVAQFGGRFQAIGTSQLTIPAGAVSAPFPVRTFGVATRTTVTLRASTLGSTATTTLAVDPASVVSLAFS